MDARTQTMPNGATVADWLSTAANSATVAAMYLNDVRNGVAGAGKLAEALEHLEQARDEVLAIQTHLVQ